jgi:hypothetical protein
MRQVRPWVVASGCRRRVDLVCRLRAIEILGGDESNILEGESVPDTPPLNR